MKNHKGQAALETLIMVGVLLVMFALFIAMIAKAKMDYDMSSKNIFKNIYCNNVAAAINHAKLIGKGFRSKFYVPYYLKVKDGELYLMDENKDPEPEDFYCILPYEIEDTDVFYGDINVINDGSIKIEG